MAGDKTAFNDPIHGYMEFDSLLVKIIHTPCFQRMKDIKQLGASYWIFPGASHNRFEHSLGTAHLAGMMIERLRDILKDKDEDEDKNKDYITKEDVLCVKIAALCHDLGHGPFSHVFDTRMKTKLIKYHQNEIDRLSDELYQDGKKDDRLFYHRQQAKKMEHWEHEDASCAMFDYILENTEGLKDAFEKENLKEKEQSLIKDLIKGKKPDKEKLTEIPTTKDGKPKWFLFEIVANKIYEVDCDKFDYFARDCHNLGMKSNFDHLRYIHNIRIKEKNNELHLCPRDKLDFNIYELFHTRWSLHHRAYQHKTTKAVEEMITDAFILLEEKYKFSEAVFDMEKYAKLTDSIFYEILRSDDTDEKTKKAKEILKRIQQRKLYEFYYQFQPAKKIDVDGLKAAEEIASLMSKGGVQIDPKVLFVNIVNIHFGKKDQDPVKSIVFYKKDGKIADPRDDVSRMLPQNFSEPYVRLYGKESKDPAKDGDREKNTAINKEMAIKCFEEWSKKYK